jgi:hypothetical protein
MDFTQSIVHDDKLGLYFFNPKHSTGWPKGRFLISIGFSSVNPMEVIEALRNQATFGHLTSTKTDYGTRLEVDGPITSPTGTIAQIRTVWYVSQETTIQRFVTFKPLRKVP